MEDIQQIETTGRFEFDGGLLCLDFANTLDWHASEHPKETLNEYSDLVTWGVEAGIVSAPVAAGLLEYAAAHTQEAADWLEKARVLREAIYRIALALAAGGLQAVDSDDLEIVTQFWRIGAQSRKMTSTGGELKWIWQFQPNDMGMMVWPVAQSEVDLLESDQHNRVGQCEDERGCGFLFLDTSRNRSRRWCSMETCGNRAKANRHYARSKK